MLDFEWNEMKEKQGWAEVALPMWEKKIWNSSSAPNLRTVASVAADVASAVLAVVPGGQAAAPFVALSDDLLFAGLDYGLGYKDGMDVGKDLGRKAAVTAISTYTGAKFAGMSNQVLQTAAVSSINTTASTAVYSTSLSDFRNGIGSFNTWKGTVASVAGSAVTFGMDKAILGDSIKDADGNILSYTKTQGFSAANNASIQKFTSFTGSLASSGVTYGLTGSTTFNILDVADLGLAVTNKTTGQKQAVHSGLLEWTIGGDNAGLHLGSGGTNISAGTIAGALNGLSTVNVNSQINSYTRQNGLENLAVGMRMQYGYGGKAENTLLKEVLGGTIKIALDGTDGNAETVDKNGVKTVHINGYNKDMTLEEQFDLGIKLSHESYRNGLDDGAIGQILETGIAVIGHSALAQNILDDGIYKAVMDGVIAGSKTLGSDLEQLAKLKKENLTDEEKLAFLQYVNKNYDSSKDYWLVKMDGTIEKTEDKAFYREVINENGETVPDKIKGSEYEGNDEIALMKAVGGFRNFISMKMDLKNGIYKIANLGENDSLGVTRDDNNKYTFFIAGLDFIREGNALRVYDNWSIDRNNYTKDDYEKVENTATTFWMKDAFTGNDIARETFKNAFTSIDNTNNPNQSIVSEYFKMYLVNSNDWRKDNYGVSQVGVFNGAETMEGRILDMLGKDRPGAKSTLYHPMSQLGGSENCIGPMSDYGIEGYDKNNNPIWNNANAVGSGAYYFNEQLKLYKNLGIYNGYQFNIHLKGKLLQ